MIALKAKPRKQQLRSDCAAACLAYLAEHYGQRLPLGRLRRLAGSTRSGTTVLGIIDAARSIGLSAKGVKVRESALATVPTPVIAHVRLPGGRDHYLVVTHITEAAVVVMDPAAGRIARHSHAEFASFWSGILVLVGADPGALPATPAPDERGLARFQPLLAAHRGAIVQVVAGAAAISLMGLAMSWYVQKLVDAVIPHADERLLTLLGLGMVILAGVRTVLGWFQFRLGAKLVQRLDAALVLGYVRHLLRLPQAFYGTMRVGEMTARLGDVVQVRSFLAGVIVSLVLNPLVLALSLAALFAQSATLAWLTLAVAPVQLAALCGLNSITRRYQRRIKERGADFNAHLTESLHGISTVRRFALEEHVADRAEADLVQLLRESWRAGLATFGVSTAAALASQLHAIGLLWFGTELALHGRLSAGQLMGCYTLAMFVSGSLGALIGISSDFQQARVAAERVCEILDEPAEEGHGMAALTPAMLGPIRLADVSVRHPGRSPSLERVSLTFAPGEISVVTGQTGSGKSTLLLLLQKLHAPSEGTLRMGEIDYSYLDPRSLRSQLSVLPQKVDLFSGTIVSNIAPGESEPDLIRIEQVCRELDILGFIEGLPQKLRTEVAEGGHAFSGGQRQKIALARTFYRPAAIYLLDEPTAALDGAATRAVAACARARAQAGATVIIATHSPVLIAAADRTFEIEKGKLRDAA